MTGRATVIGAGITGLTTALRLAEAGWQVGIRTGLLPSGTTSGIAAAVWYPYLALPRDRVLSWSRTSYEEYARVAPDPGAAVVFRTLLDLAHEPRPDPWWADAVPSFEHAAGARSGYAHAWSVRVPVVHAVPHLNWLVQRAQALGVAVRREPVARLADAFDGAELVVNCAGLGARELADDPAVIPVRGQVLRLSNPGIDVCLVDNTIEHAPTYVIPRFDDVIAGGTADPGVEGMAPDLEATRSILGRAIRLEPRLAAAEVLDVRVGLRPARPQVRLEEVAHPEGRLIHNYGHGGSGWTLAWGCADEIARMARRVPA